MLSLCSNPRLLVSLLVFVLHHFVCQAQVPIATDSILKKLHQNIAKDSNRVVLLNQLAFNNYFNEPLVSLQYALEAQEIADSIRFTRGEADAFRHIGLAFWAQADMATAINYYFTGLRIAEINNHWQVQADIFSNLGTAYLAMGNTAEASTFLNQSLALQQQLKNKWREAVVMNSIGDVYLSQRQYDKATEAYTFALNRSKESQYLLGESTNLRNLGNVLEHQGQYDSALTIYLTCVALSKKIDDNRGVILSMKSIASVYLEKNNLTLAEAYIEQALTIAMKANVRAVIRDLYELMVKIKEAQGDKNEAFRYFKLFTVYKDSVQSLRTVTEVAGQRIRYETEKKQTEIELLKKDAELQATRITDRNYMLALASVALLSVLVLLVVSIKNYRSIKEKTKEIVKQHHEVKSLNHKLVLLNEEMLLQQEEVMSQRDELTVKNREVELMNRRVMDVNENLETMVKARTSALENQNRILLDYAFINAHKLRAPLASIMGLVNLLMLSDDETESKELLNYLQTSSKKLDDVIRTITETIDKGLNVFDNEELKKTDS